MQLLQCAIGMLTAVIPSSILFFLSRKWICVLHVASTILPILQAVAFSVLSLSTVLDSDNADTTKIFTSMFFFLTYFCCVTLFTTYFLCHLIVRLLVALVVMLFWASYNSLTFATVDGKLLWTVTCLVIVTISEWTGFVIHKMKVELFVSKKLQEVY